MFKILLIFCISLSALGAPLGLKKLRVQSGMHVDYVDGEDIKSRIFGYRLNLEIEDELSPDMDLFFASSVILETGSNEVVASNTEFAPLETIVLNQGGVHYHPFDVLGFKFGALSPGEYESPLLLTSSPVIGAQQILNFNYVYLKALQAIPNNNRLARRTGKIDNGTPSYYMETLGFKWNKYLKLELSHYMFKDLAPNIAEQSLQFGNSINGTGESSRFNYGFNGYNAYLESNLYLGAHRLRLFGQYIVNDEAPVNRNEGYLAGAHYQVGAYGILVENYRNETDTSPGFYNSKYYGHNNNEGSAIALMKSSKKIDFQLKYYQFNPIEENSIQFKTEIVTMNLYINYDL